MNSYSAAPPQNQATLAHQTPPHHNGNDRLADYPRRPPFRAKLQNNIKDKTIA